MLAFSASRCHETIWKLGCGGEKKWKSAKNPRFSSPNRWITQILTLTGNEQIISSVAATPWSVLQVQRDFNVHSCEFCAQILEDVGHHDELHAVGHLTHEARPRTPMLERRGCALLGRFVHQRGEDAAAPLTHPCLQQWNEWLVNGAQKNTFAKLYLTITVPWL